MSELSVKELKAEMAALGLSTDGCVERSDLVRPRRELLRRDVPAQDAETPLSEVRGRELERRVRPAHGERERGGDSVHRRGHCRPSWDERNVVRNGW